MSKFIDYYNVLGLDRSSSIVEIRKAYRKLALVLHPDVNGSSRAKEDFIAVCQAYSVLKSISTKARYDSLYDHYVLKIQGSNSSKFNRRESSRNERVRQRAERGRARAAANAQRPKEQFRKKTVRTSFWDGLALILELLANILMIGG